MAFLSFTCRYLYVDSPVCLQAGDEGFTVRHPAIGRLGDGLCFALALCIDAVGRNAFGNQILLYRLRPLERELLVVLR